MSSKRNITYKCPYCDKRFNKENLVIHVGDKHDDMIPQGYSAFRVVFDYINKKPAGYNGKCVICGKESGWDEAKGKYNRLCSNPECKKKYVQSFEDRMMKSKGVTRISSTADGQAKMLANRKISGEYKFQDGGIKTYTGTYEKKALEFMDKVMNIKSEDVTTPGPILEYMFEGKKHMYISDIYYIPYNLIIEVKDGGNNPNNRSMPEYRAKQIAKEKWIIKNTDYNYLRLTNNDFSQLLAAFMELKMEMSNDTPERVVRINEGQYIEESNNELSFKSDKDLLEWMKKNIKYSNYTKLKSHDEVLKSKKGSCHDQVMFEYEELKKLGYSPRGLFIMERDKNNQGGTTHSLVYYKKGNKICWFEHAWEGQEGIGEHDSLSDIKDIIKDMYNNYGWGNLRKYGYLEFKSFSISAHKPGESLQQFIDRCFGESINEGYIEEVSRSGIKSDFLEKGDSCYNLDKWPDQYNILFITGISGSGKTTLGIDLAKEYNCGRVELDYIAVYYLRKCKERNAYDKFRNKLQNDCPEAVEFFDLNPPEKYGLREKWVDTGDILTDFCNWFVTKFGNNRKPYIINGSYIYEIFDVNFFYDKPLIIKDINLMKTVFRRTWREFIDHKDDKFFNRLESAYKAFKTGLSKEYRKANKDFKSYRKDMDKNAELVESYIEEGFLKSEPDILYNKEAFDNGDINICFITGHSGSGKSTLAHGQESKTVEVYELDDLQCIADRFTMANLKEYGDLIYTYFKGPGKQFYTTWDQLKKDMTPGKDYEDKLYPGFVAYAIDWAKKHKDKKFILEGVWLFCNNETGKPYFEPSYFKDYAFYIKGTSAVKSKWRAAKRDMKYDMKEESHNRLFWIKSFTKSFFFKNWKWYKFDEKRIQVFRDYFKDKPETVLKESYIEETSKPKILYHGSHYKLNGYIDPKNKSFEDNNYVFATPDRSFALCYSGNPWYDDIINQSYYNGQLTITEIQKGALDKVFNTDGYIYTIVNQDINKFMIRSYSEYLSTERVKYSNVEYIDNVLDEMINSGIEIYRYPSKPSWWNKINHESVLYEGQNNTLSISQIKAILKKISDKVKSDSKPPTGNQNCMLCTWCLEAQLRGYNILPRPVYSPRDIIFKQVPYNIVKNPEKLKIRNKNDVTKQVLGTGNGSRYYVHVNWKGGSGGHEFIIMNINNKVYVLDAQQNELSDINISVNGLSYFNDINYANSYIIRLDNKELNKDILKYNDNKYIIEWDDVKDPEYMKSDEYLNESKNKSTLDSNFKKKKIDFKYYKLDINDSNAKKYLETNSFCKRYLNYISKNSGEILVDKDNDKLIGYIWVGKSKDRGLITGLDILDDYKGYGLSEILLKDAINDYGAIHLTVDPDNEIAIHLYEKFGFVIVNYYNDNSGEYYYMKLESKLNKKEKEDAEKFKLQNVSEAYTKELGKIQRDPEIIDSYGFISSDGIYNENVKIKGFNKWLRGRSELLILDGDKLYLKKDPKKGYSIPGGGWEKDEDHNLSAIRETNEEARIKVKNVNYVSSYVAYFPPKDWVKEKISEENWWYGEYIELYIGEYDGQYKGKVDKIDQDKAMESGKFYDIKSVYNDLIPIHQEALSDIINEASTSNYKFLDIKSNKSKALEYLKANSETKFYAEDTIKNYNGELVIYNNIMIGRILVGDKKDKGFITDFSIDEEHRGNRLGSKLIDDAINKYHGVDLLVDKDNELALNMYKRRGFVIVKTYKNQYYMKLESKLKEDTIMMNEAMNALMTGFIPGSVDNPNNTYIVNYMQNNVFSGEDPNEGIGVSDNPKLTNLIIRDSNGILKRVDESFLDDKTYKVYIIELSKEEVSNRLSKYMGESVKEGFIYETLTGHKLYTNDQIQFESGLHPIISYQEYMKAFEEICNNYFQAKDKTLVELNKNFIPKEVRFTNNSGLMSSKKVYNLNEYINAKSDTNILECLDISIK